MSRYLVERVFPSAVSRVVAALLCFAVLHPAGSVHADPPGQSSAEESCARGVEFFQDGQTAQALPLLEAGFAAREEARFENPDDLGRCALTLGNVRSEEGEFDESLEAYGVALQVFQTSGNRHFEGFVLSYIGEVYYKQERYDEALDAYEDALVIMRDVGERVWEAWNLNAIGLAYTEQGRYEEALDAHESALAIRRKTGDQAGQGTSFHNIGAVYTAQGRYKQALDAYEQALAIHRELGDAVKEAATLRKIGIVYVDQAHYEEALEFFEQSLAISRDVGDRDGEGTTLNNMGGVYDYQGRYEAALDAFEQSVAISRDVGDRTGEGRTLSNIGGVYDSQGRYQTALDFYEQALTIQREVSDWAGQGTTLNNIGWVFWNQGRYEAALDAYEQALAAYRAVEDRDGEHIVLNNVGEVYSDQGRYEEALAVFEQALVIVRELGDQAGEWMTLSNIGRLHRDHGYLEEALDALEQTLAIVREVDDPAGEVTTLHNIGLVYKAQGRYKEALETYERALAILRDSSDQGWKALLLADTGFVYAEEGRQDEALDLFVEALAILRDSGEQAIEGVILGSIAGVYRRQGDRERALDFYEQAMDVLESVRATAGSEEGRASFIAKHAGIYTAAASLYHEQGRDEDAFLVSERGRARSFLDSLATGQVQLSDENLTTLLTDEREAYAARQAARNAVARARATSDDNVLIEELEGQLTAAEETYAYALEAIEARGEQLAVLIPARGAVLDLDQVQALLNEQTTLISYQVRDEGGSLAFVVTRDRLSVVELPEATSDNLQTVISDLHQWLNIENPHPLPLQKLYDWLIAPLADQIHTSQVGIVPHQVLHYVPFAALTDGERYFGEQHTLFLLPSASALPFIQAKAESAGQDGAQAAVVFGDPATSDPALPRLGFAADEARQVAELLRSEVYSDKDASEDRLWAGAVGAGILHLAAHGSFNEANPLYSAIALAPGSEHDGRLEAREIYGLPLVGNDMVVLSACETNVGSLSRGDELVGLTRAFFFAGSPTVVSSLWSVDDAATSKLMVAFYRHWQNGMNKAEALQAAQAEVRAEYPSPFYWAAFVLSGDPGTSSTPASRPEEPASGVTTVPTSPPQSQWTRGPYPVLMVLLVGACSASAVGLGLVLLGGWVVWRHRRQC